MKRATTKLGKEANQLLAEAKEQFTKAELLSPGSGAYSLACWSALHNEEEQCKHWLYKSHTLGMLPSCQHLSNDPDLHNVRSCIWFKEFLFSVCS